MTKIRCMLLVSLMSSVALLAGCKSLVTGCLKPSDPRDVQSRSPLRVPLGVDPPDTRSTLAIPPLDTSAVPPVSTRCLEDPPKVADLVDPGATDKQRKKEARKERLKQAQGKQMPGPRK